MWNVRTHPLKNVHSKYYNFFPEIFNKITALVFTVKTFLIILGQQWVYMTFHLIMHNFALYKTKMLSFLYKKYKLI